MSIRNIASSLIFKSRAAPIFNRVARLLIKTGKEQLLVSIFSRVLSDSQYWPLAKIADYQEQMIKKIIKHARNSIPFWQGRLTRQTVITDISPMTKKDFRVFPPENYLARNAMSQMAIKGSTSGSTGMPFKFFVDRFAYPWRRAIYRRVHSWGGMAEKGMPLRILNADRFGLAREGVFISCLGLRELEEKKGLIYSHLCKESIILEGFASYLLFLARLVEKEHIPSKIRFVISSSEFLSVEHRSFIEKVFQAPVFNCYSSRETGYIATECEYHDGFHVHSENIFLEILDDRGDSVAPGETGHIAITTFDNLVMPLIRYQLGDVGNFILEPCRCGRTLPRIKFLGRNLGWIVLPDGRIIHLFEFARPLTSRYKYVLQYQIVQEATNSITVYIVPTGIFSQNIKSQIFRELKALTGNGVSIVIKETDFILPTSGGKQQNFISHVSKMAPF